MSRDNSISNSKKFEMDMTSGPLLGKMIRFSVPIMLTGILQLLFNAADLVMVGRYTGSAALAGVGCCSSLINLIINTFIGFSVGSVVVVAQHIGARKYGELQRLVNTTFTSSIIIGLIVGVFGFFAAEPLLILMDTPDDVLAEAVPYMRAYFVGVPACVIYNYMASVLRSTGDTRRPLYFLTVAGVVNVIFNYVMIRFFSLGAMGVGIATAASQFVAATMILIHMVRMDNACRLTGLCMDFRKLGAILAIGLPAGIQSALFSLSNVLIQSTVNGYGTVVMAGNAAAGNLEGFVYTSMNSVYQTALTFTGQNMGAGQYSRIKKIALRASLIVFVLGTTLGSRLYIFGRPLLSIYEPGKDDVIAAGMNRLLIIGLFYCLCGLMDVICGMLRGMGKTFVPMIVSLIGSCAFRIVWIYTVCVMFPDNILVLYISYPISWTLTAGAHLFFFIRAYRKLTGKNSDAEKKEENALVGAGAEARTK